MVIKPWKKFTPFYLYAVLASCVGMTAATSEPRPFANIFLLIILGLLSWSLGEYIMHRFAFHYDANSESSQGRVRTMHLAHHDDPQEMDQLFVSLWMSAPTAIGYCLLAWAMLGDWHSMAYLFLGVVFGYFSYEWLHYQAHHGRLNLRLFKYLKKYHLLHHGETPNLRFGVTSPLFDYLFGTFQPVSNRAQRSKR